MFLFGPRVHSPPHLIFSLRARAAIIACTIVRGISPSTDSSVVSGKPTERRPRRHRIEFGPRRDALVRQDGDIPRVPVLPGDQAAFGSTPSVGTLSEGRRPGGQCVDAKTILPHYRVARITLSSEIIFNLWSIVLGDSVDH